MFVTFYWLELDPMYIQREEITQGKKTRRWGPLGAIFKTQEHYIWGGGWQTTSQWRIKIRGKREKCERVQGRRFKFQVVTFQILPTGQVEWSRKETMEFVNCRRTWLTFAWIILGHWWELKPYRPVLIPHQLIGSPPLQKGLVKARKNFLSQSGASHSLLTPPPGKRPHFSKTKLILGHIPLEWETNWCDYLQEKGGTY